MKKITAILLLCLSISLLFLGCGKAEKEPDTGAQMMGVGNPWSSWDSLSEAESAAGFSLGLPEVIAGSYTADGFRTMTGGLMEVTYRDGEYEVCVRKQKGEDQDISGDYNEYQNIQQLSDNGITVTVYNNPDSNGVKQVISYRGYSWSLVAPNGYWGDSNQDFLNAIRETE